MKNTGKQRWLSFLLCVVLIAAMALGTMGCNEKAPEPSDQAGATVTELGEGAVTFAFEVTDKEGKTTRFTIHTDKDTVGDALLEQELIAGEESEYGLYVKTVNGIAADYNTDGTYWAFYVNGEYASSGVDTTAVVEGETYAFKVEK